MPNNLSFDFPELSLTKAIISRNQDLFYSNLFLHFLPYIVATAKNLADTSELDWYKMLISSDIKNNILDEQNEDTHIKYYNAAVRKKSFIKFGDQKNKDTYKFFYKEFSYYQKLYDKNKQGIEYGYTYKHLDKYLETNSRLLICIYFIVQNLIRLASDNDCKILFSIKNAELLSKITCNYDEISKILDKNKYTADDYARFFDDSVDINTKASLTDRWIKTAWDKHKQSALLIFGVIQTLIDDLQIASTYQVHKFYSLEMFNKLMDNMNNVLLPKIKTLSDYNEDFKTFTEKVLIYTLGAQRLISNKYSENAPKSTSFFILSDDDIKALSIEDKAVDLFHFKPLSDLEKALLIPKCKK